MSVIENTAKLNNASSVFASAEEAIHAFKNGEMLILTDDENRENEGDFVLAAEFATPEIINLMIQHGRGLVCVSIPRERARELELDLMVKHNTALLETAFTVSVDAVGRTTTGISAFDRAATIQTIVDPRTVPADLARPGHIFPLVAHPAGIVGRPGHTEAVIDLAKAAGVTPAGVLCEILDNDGTAAKTARLIEIARAMNIKIAHIKDLLAYRYRHETLIRDVGGVHLPGAYGDFKLHLYENCFDEKEQHLAMVKGDISCEEPLLVRMHSECLTGDIFGSFRCDCGDQLHTALQQIEEEGQGVLLYLRQEGRGIGLLNKIKAYTLQDTGKDTVEANEALGFEADLREYWFAAQMLRMLGIKRVRLLTNNPKKVADLVKYGIEVVERIPIIMPPKPQNLEYLRTKKEKLGHWIAV